MKPNSELCEARQVDTEGPAEGARAFTSKGRHYRAIFISDVHLGTSACQADYLADFLRHNSADKLYLVGDIVDLLAMRKRIQLSAGHEEVVGLFLDWAKRGTQVCYIPGNHDAFFRRFCGQTIAGIDIRLSAEYVALNNDRFFVSHGDELDSIMQAHGLLMWLGDVSHGVLLKINTLVNAVRKSWNLPYWSLARSVKKRISHATSFIDRFEKLAAHRASEKRYHGHICGHIHHWQMTYHNRTLYLNDGDWVEHCTALVETEYGEWQLLHWSDHEEILASSKHLKRPEAQGVNEGLRPISA
ncbi:MAG: UDP-2,3-diacylglucosamine hydrolase [Oleiphilus sp.]|nr:MAG: UDP-2,3-diacylglucosamine hydrolase [Oleiphilus sp.]